MDLREKVRAAIQACHETYRQDRIKVLAKEGLWPASHDRAPEDVVAQAAIDTVFAELREESLAMLNAGYAEYARSGSICFESGNDMVSRIFQAMLDVAQKGE